MRLGILSFAHLHAEDYLSSLGSVNDVEIIGIADENQARGQYFAKQYNARLFDDYEALLKEKPDGVIVCSENARHFPLVKLAAQAGVHVLCEKPLATTLQDAHMMVEVCEKAGVSLMTAFPMRFNAPILEVKRLVNDNELGTIYGCNTTNQGALPEFHQNENLLFLNRSWFVSKELAGGGAVTDHVVHLADIMRWLFRSEVVEVFAEINTILHKSRVTVETGGLVMLTFDNGIFASIDCSWSKPAYYPTWGGLKMEIVGEKGVATVDAFKQVSTIYKGTVKRPLWSYWGSNANRAMLEEFIRAIRENRKPAITGEDGLKAVEIINAAYESARTGKPIALKH